MFNIGFGELAVILVVLIIAVGPDRLPSMMKTLGKTLRTLRQASRDIRASTGIDELMREDFDLYAPIKPSPPRRPAVIPATPEPAALPAPAEATPAPNEQSEQSVQSGQSVQTEAEPQPVSREEVIEDQDRPSVVVAPPPQAVGLPSDAAAEPTLPPTAASADASPLPAADPDGLPAETAAPNGAGAPIASTGDTLPRAPIIQPAPAKPETQPEAAPASSEPKQSGA